MAGKKKQPQQQQQDVVVAAETGAARRLWRVVRAVLYMLRRGLPSGRKLAMDLHLLLHRGKIAGKALGDFLASHRHGHHHHHHRHAAAVGGGRSFSCRALDPGLAVHEPSRRSREVEFSCSNTPSAAGGGGGLHLHGAATRRHRRRSRHHRDETDNGYLHYHNYDAAEVARVFEMLNDDEPAAAATAAYATPSPAQLLWAFTRSPTVSRQMRITESPFQEARDADDAEVDRQADEFIRRFYEQLREQKSAASTPDYYGYYTAPSPYTGGRTPRPVAAGIA